MSYTPTVWQNGDTITAQKMNKIENGIASAGSGGGGETFTVTFSEISGSGGEYTVDKTAVEIKAAYDLGKKVIGVISGLDSIKLEVVGFADGVYESKEYHDAYFQGWGAVISGGTFSCFKFLYITVDDYDGVTGCFTNTTTIS